MINIERFVVFLKETFNSSIVYFDRFKPDLIFVEIDCLVDLTKKLSVEISTYDIKVSIVAKEPSIDFSLHDYVFEANAQAENYLMRIKETGIYIGS